MNNWICMKCKSGNSDEKTRCSFCSAPREIKIEESNKDLDRITKSLNNAISNMQPQKRIKVYQKLRIPDEPKNDFEITKKILEEINKMLLGQREQMWRWMEDNVI